MATKNQTQTPSTPTVEAPKPRKPREKVNLDVKIEGVEATTKENPFARGSHSTIPDDHPLVQAFAQSFEHERTVTVKTPDPEAVVRVLRKIAFQRSQGVRVKIDDGGQHVHFLARTAVKRTRKAKAE